MATVIFYLPMRRLYIVLFLATITFSFVLYIGCSSDKYTLARRSELETAGLTELPYGYRAFIFSTPPVAPPFPAIAKNPTLFLIRNRQADVQMTPVRSDNGDYSLRISKTAKSFEDETLCILTGEFGADRLFLTESGIVTDNQGSWKCALFLSENGRGIVAWKGEPEDGTWQIDSKDGTKSALREKPANGYRHFRLYRPFWWSDSCTPSSILHEIWPSN